MRGFSGEGAKARESSAEPEPFAGIRKAWRFLMPETFLKATLYFFTFLFGACIASFYNVVAERSALKESFVKGRSHCPKCGRELKAFELIPLLSYILLRGKCRGCGEKISIRYPLIELVGGLSALFCVWREGFGLKALLGFYLLSLLITLSLIDFKTHEIPDGFHIALLPAVLASFFTEPELSLGQRALGFFIISVPMLILAQLVGGIGFGGGDIKLMAVCGALLGWKSIVCAFFIGLVAAAVYSIYLLAFKGAHGKTQIAFGPYLSIGIALSFFFAPQLIAWYLGLFFAA